MLKINHLPLIKTQDHEKILYLMEGKLYCNRLSYYRNKENNDGDTVVGDKYEALIPIRNSYIFFPDSSECITVRDGHFPTVYSDDFVYCMSAIEANIQDLAKGTLLTSADIESFGEESLIITDCSTFLKLVEDAAMKNGLECRYGLVKYYSEEYDNIQMIKDLYEDASNIAFWKRDIYKKQQEFRILFHGNLKEDVLKLSLDTNLKNISYVLPTLQLKKLMIKSG